MSTTTNSQDSIDSSAGLTDIGSASKVGGRPDDSLSSWRTRIEASIAKSRKIRGGNYVQIATVDPQTSNEPRCRTVVFRGFLKLPREHPERVSCGDDDKSCIMKMITDARSHKVHEASKQPAAEMVWWFPKSSEQYRIRGKLVFVGCGPFSLDTDKSFASARKEQWGNLSDSAREQFFWKQPGLSYSGEAVVPPGGRDEEGKLLPPPDSFLLMLLLPNRVDYLRLGDNFRQVDDLTGGSWTQARVNP